jgi:hypothetical protein
MLIDQIFFESKIGKRTNSFSSTPLYRRFPICWTFGVLEHSNRKVSSTLNDKESSEIGITAKDLCRQVLKSSQTGKVVHCARAEDSLPKRRRKFNIYNISSPAYENLSKEDMNILRRNNKSIRSWQKYRATVFSIPKTALYKELLPLLPRYRRIFLLDEDILLHGFGIVNSFLFAFENKLYIHTDLGSLSTVWDCAFWPQPPPLIVQPLVLESIQARSLSSKKTK